MTTPNPSEPPEAGPWWRGVTRAHWLVLAIASAGWVFDVFEGQIFGSCMNQALPALLSPAEQAYREWFVNVGLAAFLVGGALGGIVFGMAADRWGRRRTMALTILMYSAFTGLTALAQSWWQLAALRFLVGMGVGGEWAVAAAAVAEVFPPRARPAASGIFHASSVLGTYLAVAAGLFVVAADQTNGWRHAFLLGALPALLVFWVRAGMREPESWQAARKAAALDTGRQLGRFRDLFATGRLCRHTLLATGLAVIGLATFWGTHFRGKDLLLQARQRQQEHGTAPATADDRQRDQKNYEMLGMFLATTGGGLGLLSFAPVSQRLGRRGAFLLFHLGGFATVGLVSGAAGSVAALLAALPVFGFFTLGMHAGYAVYFPELFPTRLRGTGAGFCFNVARVAAAPVLLGFGWLQSGPWRLTLPQAILLLGCLFLVGAVLVLFAPETRGQPLPD
jgi:MFS family permease